ncbi:MAG: CoA transferase [Spongiibacteraceae bacterium]|nr:CoA transferase [Spongiibacteraceae bacterium]
MLYYAKATNSFTSNALSKKRVTPFSYASTLLHSLGFINQPVYRDERHAQALWAQSGAMWLSGHQKESPRFCPAPIAACAQGVWLALSSLYPKHFDARFSAHQLLGERAAIAGLQRQGKTSAGGACRLYKTCDGALALNLVRDDDRELLPAWLEQSVSSDAELVAVLKEREVSSIVKRARMMGLAAAPVMAPKPCGRWFRPTRYVAPVAPTHQAPLVIDLSSLWAGPLCAQLLSQFGARVIKVESTRRPDGARSGPADFYQLMNAGKESVALDLKSEQGQNQLRQLLAKADIVIEASRPRALKQMGIKASDYLLARPGTSWLSITGYGREQPMADWIAYGDDAGVAAGLSSLMGGVQGEPVFCGDAIADPLVGLHAALLALASWRQGGGLLLDISLHNVVSYCIGSGFSSASEKNYSVRRPVSRKPLESAAVMGVDTLRILQEFGVS